MVENGRIISRDLDGDDISIDFVELFLVVWHRLYLVIIAGLIFGAIAFAGTKFLITPLYTSTTKMYVLSKQSDNASVTYTDLQTGTQLTKDYMELVKSRPVLEKVIAQLNLDMDAEDLKKTLSVSTPEDTRILTVAVENPNPEMAKKIADAVREAVSIQITDIMDVESVNTVEDGNLPDKPSSPSLFKNTVIGGFLGAMLAVVLVILTYMMDDTIKTPDDVEKYLGLGVLASVPLKPGTKKTKKTKKEKGRRSAKQLAKSRKK